MVLVGIFVLVHDPHLESARRGAASRRAGPLRGHLLRRPPKGVAVVAMFAFAATVILLCAEHFADALVESGEAVGVPAFFLVQWLAPLASEAPELLVAALTPGGSTPAAPWGLWSRRRSTSGRCWWEPSPSSSPSRPGNWSGSCSTRSSGKNCSSDRRSVAVRRGAAEQPLARGARGVGLAGSLLRAVRARRGRSRAIHRSRAHRAWDPLSGARRGDLPTRPQEAAPLAA